MDATTVDAMWKGLCLLFKKKNAVVLADLLGQLHSFQTPEGGDPLKMIDKVLHCGNEYTAAGGELSDTDTAAITRGESSILLGRN